MPKSEIPSLALQIRPRGQSVEQLSLRLRVGEPGLVGTVADNALLLDLRTIFARQDATVVQLLRAALA
jgi:seryl-tRNA(Sec) selenium transferase